MQWVAVDMGRDVTPERMAWVLEACNAAIAAGSCEADVADSAEAPDAVAIVRVRDVAGRRVRIEVGRRREERSAWAARELEFESGDPASERWRSVGLALATLVGEMEQAEQEEPESGAEQAPVGAQQAGAGAEAEAQQTERDVEQAALGEERESEREQEQPVREAVAASEDAQPSSIEEVVVRPRAFVGIGALVGSGRQAVDARLGGGGRLGWIFESGLEVSLAGDYAGLSLDSGLELEWLRLRAGIGYRHWLTQRWSLGVALRVGTRRLGAELESEGESRSASAWSPHVAAGADMWWQVATWGGFWLDVELGSIGRETRLLGRLQAAEAVVPAWDTAALLGVWWAP